MSVDSSLPLAPQPPAISGDRRMGPSLVKPGNYDLPGIRDRMKSRLGDMKEVQDILDKAAILNYLQSMALRELK